MVAKSDLKPKLENTTLLVLENAEDLAVFSVRENEPLIPFEEVIENLKKNQHV